MTTAKDMRRYCETDLMRIFDAMQIEASLGRVGEAFAAKWRRK